MVVDVLEDCQVDVVVDVDIAGPVDVDVDELANGSADDVDDDDDVEN